MARLLAAALLLLVAAALGSSARAEEAAPPPAEDGAIALVPDAAPAVINWATETDPCKLLALKPDDCAAADAAALTRAFKTAKRAAQRDGGGPEAAAAIEAAFEKKKAERAAREL